MDVLLCFVRVVVLVVVVVAKGGGKPPNFPGIRKWEQSGWQVERMELHSLQEALKVEIQSHQVKERQRQRESLGQQQEPKDSGPACWPSGFGFLSQGLSIGGGGLAGERRAGGGVAGCLPGLPEALANSGHHFAKVVCELVWLSFGVAVSVVEIRS